MLDSVFLVQLVIEMEMSARALLRWSELRFQALWAELRALRSEGAGNEDAAITQGRWAVWRSSLDDLLITLSSAQEARAALERRYFGGRAASFPDTWTAWQQLRDGVQRLVDSQDAPSPNPRQRPLRGAAAARGGPTASRVRAVDEASVITARTSSAGLAVVGDSAAATETVRQVARFQAGR